MILQGGRSLADDSMAQDSSLPDREHSLRPRAYPQYSLQNAKVLDHLLETYEPEMISQRKKRIHSIVKYYTLTFVLVQSKPASTTRQQQ